MKRIGITLGDPCGIGPEIVIKALQHYSGNNQIVLYGNCNETINEISPTIIKKLEDVEKKSHKLLWINDYINYNFKAGKPSKKSGLSAYQAIKNAGEDARKCLIDAIVTAPISKHFIQLTHPKFIGHTEFFANIVNKKNFVMSFFSKDLNVALLTTHLALREVSSHLKIQKIIEQIKIINQSLEKYFDLKNPKLALLGLNPHSGEEGKFGREEIKIFKPVIEKLQQEGIEIEGAFPADTFFAGNFRKYDITISAYHDQALIPFKMLSFETGVNITLGLPFIRTSVDHGTAFDIAGKKAAKATSMINALQYAEKMLK